MAQRTRAEIETLINNNLPDQETKFISPALLRAVLYDMNDSPFSVDQWLDITNIPDKVTSAIGDGSSHPLSEFYPTLAAAQADYSVATALTQETDQVVIHQMMNDEQNFFIPAGTYMCNYAVVIAANKRWSMKGQNSPYRCLDDTDDTTLTILKCNASTTLGFLFRLDDGWHYVENIEFDLDHKAHVSLRSDRSTGYVKHCLFKRLGPNPGVATQLVAGYAADDPEFFGLDHIEGKQIFALANRPYSLSVDGLGRVVSIGNATAGTTNGYGYINHLFMDCTGSNCLQLDVIHNVIDSHRTVNIIQPVIRYNEFTRRAVKIQSSYVNIIGADIGPTSSFINQQPKCLAINATASAVASNQLTTIAHDLTTTTAVTVEAVGAGVLPTGLSAATTYYVRAITNNRLSFYPTSLDATNDTNIIAISAGSGSMSILPVSDFTYATDTGAYCLNCIDWTSTSNGYLNIEGGIIDATGFPTGISRSTGVGVVRAKNLTLIGSKKLSRKLKSEDSTHLLNADVSNIVTNVLTYTAATIPPAYITGTLVTVAPNSGGTLPTGLSEGIIYAMRLVSSNQIQFHRNATEASADHAVISISGGVGTFSIFLAYQNNTLGFYTSRLSSDGVGYGSGIDNCTIIGWCLPLALQGDYSWARNNKLFDPSQSVAECGTSTARKGIEITDNEIFTQTPDFLGGTQIIRMRTATNSIVRGNRLIQDGNTTHSTRFISYTDAGSTGFALRNMVPSGTVAVFNSAGSAIQINESIYTGRRALTTAVGNVGTGEDTLQTDVIDVGKLMSVGDVVNVVASGTFANNNNAKTLKFFVGSTAVYTKTLAPAVLGEWRIDARIARTAASAQDVTIFACTTEVQANAVRVGDVDLSGSSHLPTYVSGLATSDQFSVRSSAGEAATTITIDGTETGLTLVAKLNAVANIDARLTSRGFLEITANNGYSLILANVTNTPIDDLFSGTAATTVATTRIICAQSRTTTSASDVSPITVRCTGTGTSDNDIVQEFMSVQ